MYSRFNYFAVTMDKALDRQTRTDKIFFRDDL